MHRNVLKLNLIKEGMIMKKLIPLVILLLLLSFVIADAEEKTKTGSDPTDFITRIEPSFEHIELENDIELDLTVLRGDLALLPNLSLRLDIPLASIDPPAALEPLGFDAETGLGDIITQLLFKPYSDDQVATLFGIRFDLDTASEEELGQGGTTYAPLVAAAWYPTKGFIIAPVFQWFLGENLQNDPLPGERERNELSYRQLVLWQPMHPYVSWLLADPELIIDFENDDKTNFTIGVEYGKMVSKTVGLFIKPKMHAGGSDKVQEWAIKIGFRYMFPGFFLF
jgi:hypothetical protein